MVNNISRQQCQPKAIMNPDYTKPTVVRFKFHFICGGLTSELVVIIQERVESKPERSGQHNDLVCNVKLVVSCYRLVLGRS